jgi:ABC-2 type transport system ATP-binding protein
VSDVAIEVKELTRRFADFTAVDRISFDVRAGEVFASSAPTARGKTTAIRMLIGLLEPSGGTARIAGHDIYTESRRSSRASAT